jgi:hypothetical protein
MSDLTKENFDSICRVCTSDLNGNQAKSIFDIFVTASKTLEFCLRTRVSFEKKIQSDIFVYKILFN